MDQNITPFSEISAREKAEIIGRLLELDAFAKRVQKYQEERGVGTTTFGQLVNRHKFLMPRFWKKLYDIVETMDMVDAFMERHPVDRKKNRLAG